MEKPHSSAIVASPPTLLQTTQSSQPLQDLQDLHLIDPMQTTGSAYPRLSTASRLFHLASFQLQQHHSPHFEHGQLSSSFGSFSGSKAPCLWPFFAIFPSSEQFFTHILMGFLWLQVASAPGPRDPGHVVNTLSFLSVSQTWHFSGSRDLAFLFGGACWGFSSPPRFPVGFPVGSMAQRVHARACSHTEKACAPVVNPRHICWGS
mmetsp:Transcript_2720/g.6546  ORF Transcript_2720/g.6546 Transcript_2720/m.6546 type:complete len:205 (-) Transcript_2720:82-696(-)